MSQQHPDSSKRIGQGMLIAAWIILMIAFTLYFREDPKRHATNAILNSEAGKVVIRGTRQGHYLAQGTINQQAVVFFIDTGATKVSIPAHIADQLNLERGFPMQVQTANGQATAYATRLDSLTIGGIRLENVLASINPGMQTDKILLGMSALKQLEFSQSQNTLTLTKRQ